MQRSRDPLSRIVAFAVALITGVILLSLALSSLATAQDRVSSAQGIGLAIRAMNFENVRVTLTGDTLDVEYENRIYRNPLEAMGAVAGAVARRTRPETTVRLIVLGRGIPVLTATAVAADWVQFLDGSLGTAEFRHRISITDGSGLRRLRGQRVSEPRLSPSWRKLDLAIRPLAQIELGIADDPFKFGLWLAPEVTTMPFRGALLTAQGVVQLRDDMDPFARRWRPGRTTFSYAGWLPGGVLGAASTGYFPSNRYGFAWELGRYVDDGRVELQLTGDYTGFLKFSKSVVLYSDLKAWSGVVSITHRPRRLDIRTTLSGGRFLYGDVGARLEVARRFHESEFSFFAVKGDRGGSVAGLRFVVPLPLRHLGAPRRVRFVTTPDFPFEYREDVNPVGTQVNMYDDADRLRQRTDPVFLWNNLDQLKTARDGLGGNR